MPDIKVLTETEEGTTIVEIPRFNDSSSGVIALAQTASLMLLDPNYGNMKNLIKNRVETTEIEEIVLQAVDVVEQAMLREQGTKIMIEGEVLVSLEIEELTLTKDSVDLTLRVTNKLNEETIINI